MQHVCSRDGQPLKYGEGVVQLIRGEAYLGYISPAFSRVMLEWHRGCFNLVQLRPYSVLAAPYRCEICLHRIEHGDQVMCLVLGFETSRYYSISERRGYDVYSIRHVKCEAERKAA